MKKYLVLFPLALLLIYAFQTSQVGNQMRADTPGSGIDLSEAVISTRPITIATTADSIVIAAGENSKIVMYSSGDIVIRGKTISFQAEQRLALTVNPTPGSVVNTERGITIDATSGSEEITIGDQGDNQIIIDQTNQRLRLLTDNGNIDIHSPNGTLDVKGTQVHCETTGETEFKAYVIRAEAQTDYRVKASNIIQEAIMDFRLKGMNVKSEASMEYKIKGLNVTSEAGVNQQVKGTMITVQSTGPNTIKGMPVMIN